MTRPVLHDPFLAWEGKLDDAHCRIVFEEFYENSENPASKVFWGVTCEYSPHDDAMGKPVWREITGFPAVDAVRCMALTLVDALDKRPDWAKEPH